MGAPLLRPVVTVLSRGGEEVSSRRLSAVPSVSNVDDHVNIVLRAVAVDLHITIGNGLDLSPLLVLCEIKHFSKALRLDFEGLLIKFDDFDSLAGHKGLGDELEKELVEQSEEQAVEIVAVNLNLSGVCRILHHLVQFCHVSKHRHHHLLQRLLQSSPPAVELNIRGMVEVFVPGFIRAVSFYPLVVELSWGHPAAGGWHGVG
mmetsp:Transcript_17459/g.45624  ORF Transcript_17459/g.45624 Transcript_17459/m.45624 type:complete len:203 (+) Transcript_17459:136-744(+)